MFLEQQGIGAEINKFLSFDDACNNLVHVFVKQRLTSGDGNHRGTTFIYNRETFVYTKIFAKNLFRMLDLATAGAC
jgi:hypothetical protein